MLVYYEWNLSIDFWSLWFAIAQNFSFKIENEFFIHSRSYFPTHT